MKRAKKVKAKSLPTDTGRDKPTPPEVAHLNDIANDNKKPSGAGNSQTKITPDYSANLPLWRAEILAELEAQDAPMVSLPPSLSAPVVRQSKKNMLLAAVAKIKAPVESIAKTALPAALTLLRWGGDCLKKYYPRKYQRLICYYLAIALVVAIIFYAAIMYGRLDKKIPQVATMMAVPVLYVEGEIVTYGELARQKIIVQRFNRLMGQAVETEQAAKQAVIENIILRQTAEKYKIVITTEQQQQVWRTLQNEFADEPAMARFIAANFGFNLSDYQKYIVRPILLRLAVYNALNHQPINNDKTLRLITDIKREIKTDKIDFAAAAQQYSQDESTRSNGGDLGWYAWGSLPAEFETAVSAIEIGEISEPVRTIYGYHLINLLEIERGPSGQIKNYHAAHILRKTFDYNKWLQQQRDGLTIVELLRFN